MILAVVLAVACGASDVPFASAPPVEVWASEDWPVEALAAAARLPGATLGIRSRSNMLRPALAALLSRSKASLLELRLPLAPAHLEQLFRLPRTTLVLAADGGLDAPQLARLGPQRLRIRATRLDAAAVKAVRALKNLEVELDVGGRLPDQEELAALRALGRARRIIRLRAADPPELLAALEALRPLQLVVRSEDGRLPEAMLTALARARIPTRVALDSKASPGEVRRLAALPQVSLELPLEGEPEAALAAARRLLGNLTLER